MRTALPMRAIKKTHIAEHDLDAIFLDGLTRFGLKQAEKFIDQIDESFSMLAENPRLGRNHDYVQSGLFVYFRPYPCKIAYQFDGNTLFILRIFHGKQDYERLLSEG